MKSSKSHAANRALNINIFVDYVVYYNSSHLHLRDNEIHHHTPQQRVPHIPTQTLSLTCPEYKKYSCKAKLVILMYILQAHRS